MSRTILPYVAALALLVPAGRGAAQDQPKKKAGAAAALLDVKGQLLDTDPVDQVHNQPCKLYTVKLLQGKTYTIDLESDAFDTYLRLETAAGKELEEDDDGGKDTDAQIVFAPDKDDTFKVVATRFDDDGSGNFTLKVRELKLKTGKALDLGADGLNVGGRLTNKDPADPVGPKNRYKAYSVKMKAGRAYAIDFESDDFDAFLRVHDGRFRKLAVDDDGGDGLNSRLTFRPDADGVYHVIATTLDGELGAFRLRVREGE